MSRLKVIHIYKKSHCSIFGKPRQHNTKQAQRIKKNKVKVISYISNGTQVKAGLIKRDALPPVDYY